METRTQARPWEQQFCAASSRLCQVDVVRTGFASDETAIQTFGLGTRHPMSQSDGLRHILHDPDYWHVVSEVTARDDVLRGLHSRRLDSLRCRCLQGVSSRICSSRWPRTHRLSISCVPQCTQ